VSQVLGTVAPRLGVASPPEKAAGERGTNGVLQVTLALATVMVVMADDRRFVELATSLASVEARLVALDDWCQRQLVEREAKIAKLERANAWMQTELGRLRMIIASVGVIAGQAQPPADFDEDEPGT
jgi:hypothetical protein